MWATLLDFVDILREMFSKRSYCTLQNSPKKYEHCLVVLIDGSGNHPLTVEDGGVFVRV